MKKISYILILLLLLIPLKTQAQEEQVSKQVKPEDTENTYELKKWRYEYPTSFSLGLETLFLLPYGTADISHMINRDSSFGLTYNLTPVHFESLINYRYYFFNDNNYTGGVYFEPRIGLGYSNGDFGAFYNNTRPGNGMLFTLQMKLGYEAVSSSHFLARVNIGGNLYLDSRLGGMLAISFGTQFGAAYKIVINPEKISDSPVQNSGEK